MLNVSFSSPNAPPVSTIRPSCSSLAALIICWSIAPSAARSSVKSCFSRTPPSLNAMIATRSAAAISRRDVLLRVREHAQLIEKRHLVQIEVQDDQPPSAIPRVARSRHCDGRRCRGRHTRCGRNGHRRRRSTDRWRRQQRIVEGLILDEGDLLRLAVLGHDEVLGRQPEHGLALFVLDAHGLHDQTNRRAKRGLRRLLVRAARRRANGERGNHGDESDRCAAHIRSEASHPSAASASDWRASGNRTAGSSRPCRSSRT